MPNITLTTSVVGFFHVLCFVQHIIWNVGSLAALQLMSSCGASSKFNGDGPTAVMKRFTTHGVVYLVLFLSFNVGLQMPTIRRLSRETDQDSRGGTRSTDDGGERPLSFHASHVRRNGRTRGRRQIPHRHLQSTRR